MISTSYSQMAEIKIINNKRDFYIYLFLPSKVCGIFKKKFDFTADFGEKGFKVFITCLK